MERTHYLKTAISVYIRTNNNRDRTAGLLRNWAARWRGAYARMELNDSDVNEEAFGPILPNEPKWPERKLKLMSHIRQQAWQKAIEWGTDFYWSPDVDTYWIPQTLEYLIRKDLPIVGPLLRDAPREKKPSTWFINAHVTYRVTKEGR